ncbi:MAG: serine hydrolase [Treponema sp.]|nr:serine hydrolase [Treponema sp.]
MQEKLTELVRKLKEDFKVPSISVSVFKDGETFFVNEGLSDIDKSIKATPDTIYAIASSTKAFAATSIAILADEKKLNLDDPVKKHLKDFKMHDPYMTDHLTIKDALSHRGGLPRHDMVWFNRPDLTLKELAYTLKHLPPSFEPRTRMYYQNIMFALSSVIVEHVSGKPWGDFLKEKVFNPLGMTHTYTDPKVYRGKGSEHESVPYDLIGDKIVRTQEIPFAPVAGAGVMHSSVRDLDKWVRLQLGRGEFEGKRIFSEEMAKQLHGPQMIIRTGDLMPISFEEIEFENYCLGWFIESYRGNMLVHHGGTINGYKSQVGFLPKKNIGFSILTNLSGNQTPNAIGYNICDMVLGLSEIDWGKRYFDFLEKMRADLRADAEKKEEAVKKAKPPIRPLENYAGKYVNAGYGDVSVKVKDNALIIHAIQRDMDLLPYGTGHDNFYISTMTPGANIKTFIPVQFACDFEEVVTGVRIKLEAFSDMILFEKCKEEGK